MPKNPFKAAADALDNKKKKSEPKKPAPSKSLNQAQSRVRDATINAAKRSTSSGSGTRKGRR